MDEQKFEPWIPSDFLITARVEFERVVYDGGGLTIQVRETGGKYRKLALVFSELPTALRIANESIRLASLPHLPKDVHNSFFLVQNSNFLKWVNQESLGIYKSDPIYHLAIVTDEWIDLICNDQPKILVREPD